MTLSLTILFAIATGNDLALADFAEATARRSGIAVLLADAATYDFKQFARRTPCWSSPAHTRANRRLTRGLLRFSRRERHAAVHAIPCLPWATGHDAFCAAGRRVDERLEGMGATRLRARQDIDAHEHKVGRAWIADFIAALIPVPTAHRQPDLICLAGEASDQSGRYRTSTSSAWKNGR